VSAPLRVHFSCGAASATSLFLALETGVEVDAVYADTGGEHEDNMRFLKDVERVSGVPITVVRSERYSSPLDVWTKRRFLKGPGGAICTSELKRIPLMPFWELTHTHVFGFVAGEEGRLSRIQENERPFKIRSLLIEKKWRKGDCFDFITRQGIELPAPYRLGYNNANCIGCPKGGQGYWNKVRRDFPEQYEATAALQRELGEGSYFWSEGGKRISLDDLHPKAGDHREPDIECGLFCTDRAKEAA